MNRILKFAGIDALSLSETDRGEAEPEEDPRGSSTEIVEGLHLINAADQLQPAATTNMVYFDAGSEAADMSLEEIQGAIESGDLDLPETATKTDRFTPLVNPRRTRAKRTGGLEGDSDADLWHVPTDNYRAHPPRRVFGALAQEVDERDDIPNESVFGEFRERRAGGEVFGDILFDTEKLTTAGGDPVRIGLQVGWNYFGTRRFFIRPFAQQTRCKNSIRTLGSRQVIMHNRQDANWRDEWAEALDALGAVSGHLARSIDEALRVVYDFGGGMDEPEFLENDAGDERLVVPMPMSVRGFYEHAGLDSDPRRMEDFAVEEAINSADSVEREDRISAWHLHGGATYWLSWYWVGSEHGEAYRGYRRAADDLLFNPEVMADRVREEFEERQRRSVTMDVLGGDVDLDELTEEERQEIEDQLNQSEGIATVRASANTVQEAIEEFRATEERLDRIEEHLARSA